MRRRKLLIGLMSAGAFTAGFSAADRCPAYRVPEDIVAAVSDKQRRDDMETADLISRGTPSVAAPGSAGGAVSAAAVLRR